MRTDQFRRLALELPEALESSHMDHPDFRVRGRIFATLWPDHGYGVVMLPSEAQPEFVEEHPAVFETVRGKKGLQAENVRLVEK
jgi:hypothetical protein